MLDSGHSQTTFLSEVRAFSRQTPALLWFMNAESIADRFAELVVTYNAVSCIEEGEGRLSIAESEGILRIGKGDMGVNHDRNEALLRSLQAAKDDEKLPDDDGCE